VGLAAAEKPFQLVDVYQMVSPRLLAYWLDNTTWFVETYARKTPTALPRWGFGF
jgi:hypothetical protein